MKTQLFSVLLLMSAIQGTAYTQELSNLPGAFADLQLGVRPAGLGGAYTAMSNDGNAVLYNPAAAAFVPFASLTATHTRLFNIVPATFFGGHYPIGPTSLAFGLQQVGDELLEETTVALATALPAQRLLPGLANRIKYFDLLAFSVTFKLRFAGFGDNEDGGEQRVTGGGNGYGVDFGSYLQLERMRFGLTVHDAIGTFRWDSSISGQYSQRIPTRLKLGLAYVHPRLRFALDVQPGLHSDVADRVYGGLEVSVMPWLMVRGGLAQNTGGRFENKMFSAGFGLYSFAVGSYRFAIQGSYRNEDLDNAYRFSLEFFWPGRRY